MRVAQHNHDTRKQSSVHSDKSWCAGVTEMYHTNGCQYSTREQALLVLIIPSVCRAKQEAM